MENKPWIEDNDPLKEYYSLLNDSELKSFLHVFNEWNNCRCTVETDICQIKSGVQLLDFFDYSIDDCHLSLFESICSMMGGDSERLYWIPVSDQKDFLFKSYEPFMIAKTPVNKEILNYVSRSFMQMQNGGYILFDSKSRFIGIILDGYYMLLFMKKEFMNDQLNQYVENWKKLDQSLDSVVVRYLRSTPQLTR